MKQFEFHSDKCCQQAQNLVSKSKQYLQQSKQLRSASSESCQKAKHLRSKSNNVLQKSQQLHSNSEKCFRLLEQLLCDSNESLGTTGEMSSGLARLQMIGQLQTDVERRWQKLTQLQFNVYKCFEKVSLLIENTDLNTSANDSSEATTDLTNKNNILANIDSMIKKLETGNWVE